MTSPERSLPSCPDCGSHKLSDEEASGYGLKGRYACGRFGDGYAQTPACKVIAKLREGVNNMRPVVEAGCLYADAKQSDYQQRFAALRDAADRYRGLANG